MKNKISKATLQRYTLYLKTLRKLKNMNINRIMSSELGSYISIKPTTIRRDFSLLGSLGKQGYGYDIDHLISIFSDTLGVTVDEQIILIGLGNLGRALINYNHWDNVVGEIVCAFDLYPDKAKDLGIKCYHIDDLEKYIPKNAHIAIITGKENIQETVNRLVECGIRGIADFSNEHYMVPDFVKVRHVDVVSTIQELVFETNIKEGK
ncbi:MAG: redox-sensing transcriptional repressor Rex [Erysipelotrichaceae bacterium]|nr:redox-sensing transcriptional repressor Rex [Erysipelotrichaceae bacterium]